MRLDAQLVKRLDDTGGSEQVDLDRPVERTVEATIAAEWITMSQLARTARSSSLRPSPSLPTSPAIT